MKSINAKSLLAKLRHEQAPQSFSDLLVLMDVSQAHDKRALRSLLKGLVRSGELEVDHQRAYHLPDSGSPRTGTIQRMGKDLLFDGLRLQTDRNLWLRPGDRVEARVVDEEVRVLRVISRSSEPLIGVVRARGRYPYVESLSPDYSGRISLPDPPPDLADGETVEVEIDEPESDGHKRRNLTGRVIATLSSGGGVVQAVETLLSTHKVPTQWPEGMSDAVNRLPGHVNPGRHPGRRSLVDVPLVTIDGETAKDFDDAVFAETRRGGWRVIVAIADVAHYVKANGLFDRVARERGNSVYLPDRVIPMLPEALSNELCSLKPHEPRLAMVCDMKVSHKGTVTGYEFYQAVIRSWQRLTYTRVEEFIDTGSLDVQGSVQRSLRELHKVYQAFRRDREERGGLDFETHEANLELRGGRVSAIHPVKRLVAHQLIEEAMIAANVCAAKFLESHNRPGLYRVHERPDATKAEQIRQALGYAGLRVPKGEVTPLVVRDAFKQLAGRDDRWLIEMLVLRSMNQAVYTPENGGHFGLALSSYMHFTSPIRRYSDLVVHRAIKAALSEKRSPFGMDQLIATGEHISMTERRAESVSWGVDGWLKCEYVADRLGETFDGVVMGVTEFGLFVELKGYYVQGLLHISELGTDYFHFQPQSMSLVGERSGRRFKLGDELQVCLQDAIPEKGRLDLVLVKTGSSAKKGSGKTRGQSRGGKSSGGKRTRAGSGGGKSRTRGRKSTRRQSP